MDSKLQRKLFKKYPKIFRQKDLPMSETCMCWGVCCGDGWLVLIDNLCSAIQSHIDNNNQKVVKKAECKTVKYTEEDDSLLVDELESAIPEKEELVDSITQVEAVQVKEKFGGLRFYYDGGDELIAGMVSFAEHMSYSTCEYCGSTNKVTQTSGWITSLCSKCMGKHKRQKTLERKKYESLHQ